jgi:hypothetical protein
VRAYVLTCEERSEVCAETVADLARTDWGAEPTVVTDVSTHPKQLERILDTGRRVLARAVDESGGPDDVVLVCEDDVTFNRWLRHNLERWAPIVDRRPGGHLFGSLYNPNVVEPSARGSTNAVVADPRRFYGSQGMVMSVATARSLVEQWDDGHGPLDLRVSRLAARWSPLWYHVPSLVQHRTVESTWGGQPHFAVDFSRDWRA